MNLSKLIILSVCLFVFLNLNAQANRDEQPGEVYYDYEIHLSDQHFTGTDTIYDIVLIMDSVDVKKYSLITIEDDVVSVALSLNSEDEKVKSKITKRETEIWVDMEAWSGSSNWKVKAHTTDGTTVVLKAKPDLACIEELKESIRPKTTDLKFSKEQPVVEKAIEKANDNQEENPLDPDPSLNRKKLP